MPNMLSKVKYNSMKEYHTFLASKVINSNYHFEIQKTAK